MSRGVNKAILIGNVGNDPDIRATSTGNRIAKLSLATNHTYNDAAGTKREKVQWHKLTCFGKLVDIVEQYVKKGDRLYIEGRIEYSQTEKDGQKMYWCDIIVSELVMLGSTDAPQRDEGPRPEPAPAEPQPAGRGYEDDLPFAPEV